MKVIHFSGCFHVKVHVRHFGFLHVGSFCSGMFYLLWWSWLACIDIHTSNGISRVIWDFRKLFYFMISRFIFLVIPFIALG